MKKAKEVGKEGEEGRMGISWEQLGGKSLGIG
jgi:hypothetical protein